MSNFFINRTEDYGDVKYSVAGNLFAKNGFAIQKIQDYLYEIWFNEIDYNNAYKYFETTNDKLDYGSCSAIRNGNYFGRNFDWKYDDSVEFVVHAPRIGGNYASIGVSGSVPKLNEKFVNSKIYDDSYQLIPFMLKDGVNEYGVTICTNIVPTDDGENVSVPLEESKISLSSSMLIKYILDKFNNATDAVNFIKNHMTIYFPKYLHEMNYETHYMIADQNKTYLFEVINNTPVIMDMSSDATTTLTGKSYMTNFILSNAILNSDGTVYTPETMDDTHDAMSTNNITKYGSGLERYNLIVDNYSSTNTFSGMKNLMDQLLYTRAYSTSDDPSDPYWYTEFTGINQLTVATPYTNYSGVVQAVGQEYLNRKRNGTTWQTSHTAIYDIVNKTLNLTVQQTDAQHNFGINTNPITLFCSK